MWKWESLFLTLSLQNKASASHLSWLQVLFLSTRLLWNPLSFIQVYNLFSSSSFSQIHCLNYSRCSVAAFDVFPGCFLLWLLENMQIPHTSLTFTTPGILVFIHPVKTELKTHILYFLTFSCAASFSCWWFLSSRSRDACLSRVALCFSSSWSNAISASCCLCWAWAFLRSSRSSDNWASKSAIVWTEIKRNLLN